MNIYKKKLENKVGSTFWGKRGFSLLELLLVIAIAVIIFTFSSPFILNFYRTNVVNEAQSNIIDALQRARHYAVLQKNDNSFGVSFTGLADNYVLFQGATYGADVTENEIFPYDGVIVTSEPAIDEVVFSKLTGLPSATGTIAVGFNGFSRYILVDDSGLISATSTLPI